MKKLFLCFLLISSFLIGGDFDRPANLHRRLLVIAGQYNSSADTINRAPTGTWSEARMTQIRLRSLRMQFLGNMAEVEIAICANESVGAFCDKAEKNIDEIKESTKWFEDRVKEITTKSL